MQLKKIFPYIALASIISLGIYLQSNLLLNWDVSWLMHAAERLLAGGNYANDFFEINPPLILYLYTPAVVVSHLTGMTFGLALKAYLFLLGTLSLGLCQPLCKRLFPYHAAQSFLLLFAGVIFVMPILEFGQREHLLVIFILPYLLLVTARLTNHSVSRSFAITVGSFAWLGLALKPYFLIAPALIECYAIMQRRSLTYWLRPELAVIAVLFCLYLPSIFVFFPDYVMTVLPLTQQAYYAAYRTSWWLLLNNNVILFSIVSLLLASIQSGIREERQLATVLSLAIIGFVLAFLIQGTNWYYHAAPAYLLAVILDGVILWRFYHTKKAAQFWFVACLSLYPLALSLKNHWPTALSALLVFYPLPFFIFLGLIAGVLLLAAKPDAPMKAISLTLGVIALSAWFTHIVQQVDWNVHRLWLTMIFFLLLLAITLPSTTYLKQRSTVIAFFAFAMFAMPVTLTHQTYTGLASRTEQLTALIHFLQTSATAKPVYYFANSAQILLPAIDAAKAKPVMRMEDSGWIPSLLLTQQNVLKMQTLKNQYVNMVAEDLHQHRPAYVFVDISRRGLPAQFASVDYVAYFSDNAHFRQAWQAYHFIGTLEVPGTYALQVYQRRYPT